MVHVSPLGELAPVTLPLHEMLLAAIRDVIRDLPDKKALINGFDDSEFLTFQQLFDQAHAVADFLASDGFLREVACTVVRNCISFPCFMLGVLMRGGAISGASPLFTEDELERQFVDFECSVIFTDAEALERVLTATRLNARVKSSFSRIIVRGLSPYERLRMPLPRVVPWEMVVARGPSRGVSREASRAPFPPVDIDNDVALLPFSSGTTGMPKGVMLTHRNFCSMLAMKQHSFEHVKRRPPYGDIDWEAETALHIMPFYHIYGIGRLNFCLLAGATSVILPMFEPRHFCRCIEKYKFIGESIPCFHDTSFEIKYLAVAPPLLVFLAKSPICEEYDLSCVAAIISGGAPAGRDLCEEIIDVQTGVETMAPGASGELCLRGANVMRGYLRRAEETAQTIRDGWLHTGDIAYVDSDGDFFIVDRLKELIKVKGFQVAPAELEDVLLSHPLIADAAVIGVPDGRAGEWPAAFVVRKEKTLSEEDVARHVRGKVAPYKELRGGVSFISAIPKSPSGKILRRRLRELAVKKAKI